MKYLLITFILLFLTNSLAAKNIAVTVVNLTSNITFGPILIAAHNDSDRLFDLAQEASSGLKLMAEEGDISSLVAVLSAADAVIQQNPAQGNLKAGSTTKETLLNVDNSFHLSVIAKMSPTNDAFVALNSIKIPNDVGTYTYFLNAYDSGTEANSEIVTDMPNLAAITDTGATGVSIVVEGFVHIHRGTLGDVNAEGGVSDLDSRKHRWLNPVAKVTLIVQ